MSAERQAAPPPPAYVERLAVPVRWWALGGLAVVAVAAVASVLPTIGFVALPLVAAAGLLVAFLAARVVVRVDASGLSVGRATLPWSAIGAVAALDEGEAAALRGPQADPRAYLALRGWVAAAVRVDVVDPADPTPYWYVSSRRPDALAAALILGRAT